MLAIKFMQYNVGTMLKTQATIMHQRTAGCNVINDYISVCAIKFHQLIMPRIRCYHYAYFLL